MKYTKKDQREKLINGLDAASDDDLILISDLDEIPNLDCVDLKKINWSPLNFSIASLNIEKTVAPKSFTLN